MHEKIRVIKITRVVETQGTVTCMAKVRVIEITRGIGTTWQYTNY
jgi:hypothetical protein